MGFTRAAIRQAEAETDERLMALVYDLMHGINSAEDGIKRAADRIDGSLKRTLEYVEQGYHVNPPSIGQYAEDMARAVAERESKFSALVQLLTPAKVQEYQKVGK